jgi:ubiquinone/menaquinone biosynthesis C-methylase UbiE
MLPRVLEPELMDSETDAADYDAMDHSEVNARFADDLLSAMAGHGKTGGGACVLDLGTGTALIPIGLCRRDAAIRIVAVDAAESMLTVARRNVAAAGLDDRIELVRADAKDLRRLDPRQFSVVVSNSILHHVAEPARVVAEALRAASSGALMFHRDLVRPEDEQRLQQLVAAYAGNATPHARMLFADSFRAALTVEEMQSLVERFGFDRTSVHMTSDRHWTWQAVTPSD